MNSGALIQGKQGPSRHERPAWLRPSLMLLAWAGLVLALGSVSSYAQTAIQQQAALQERSYIERVKDVASVSGVRENQLIGYGLVVGLDGTGDQTTQTPFTIQSLNNMLGQLGLTPEAGNPQLRNVAAVMVTAELPRSRSPGSASTSPSPRWGTPRACAAGPC